MIHRLCRVLPNPICMVGGEIESGWRDQGSRKEEGKRTELRNMLQGDAIETYCQTTSPNGVM